MDTWQDEHERTYTVGDGGTDAILLPSGIYALGTVEDPVKPGKFWCGACQVWFDDEQSYREHLQSYMQVDVEGAVESEKAKW